MSKYQVRVELEQSRIGSSHPFVLIDITEFGAPLLHPLSLGGDLVV
jgi:hypothetical protein